MHRGEPLPILTTPLGRLCAARLIEPDFGDAERPKPRGEYWCRLTLDPSAPSIARFLGDLEERRVAALCAAKADRERCDGRPPEFVANPLSHGWRDPETGAPTPLRALRFGMPAGGGRRGGAGTQPWRDEPWRRRPVVFDCAGRPFWRAPENLIGQSAKISFQPAPYHLADLGVAGLKLRLIAVMLCAA